MAPRVKWQKVNGMLHKHCKECGELLPHTSYYFLKRRDGRTEYRSRCKQCHGIWIKKWQASKPDWNKNHAEYQRNRRQKTRVYYDEISRIKLREAYKDLLQKEHNDLKFAEGGFFLWLIINRNYNSLLIAEELYKSVSEIRHKIYYFKSYWNGFDDVYKFNPEFEILKLPKEKNIIKISEVEQEKIDYLLSKIQA